MEVDMSSPTSHLDHLLKTRIVRAGAGAGKTTQLSERVINIAQEFYNKNQRLPKILVTTFTRKATQELKERLVRLACESSRPELLQFVSSPSYLFISTIHGVLALFLKRYGPLFGFDPAFQFLDESAAAKLKKSAFRKAFSDSLEANPSMAALLESYSSQELIAILQDLDIFRRQFAEAKPFTYADFEACHTVLTERFLSYGVDIFSQIAACDTAAWSDFAQNVLGFIKKQKPESMNYVELQEQIKALGRKPSYSKKNPPFEEVLQDDLKDWFDDLEKRSDKPSFDVNTFKESAQTLQLIEELSAAFSKILHSKKILKSGYEMYDIELLTSDILKREPQVAAGFATDWDYVLTDEYQDTSPLQVEILDQLFAKVPQYFVGDPQQSIYLFRGARSEVFIKKQNEILELKGESESLQKNYRSTPELLEFINDQTAQLGEGFAVMEPRKALDDPKTVVATLAPVAKGEVEPYAPIARYIARQIQTCRFDDFAILTRKNKETIEISRYLESKGIPTQVHAASGFFQTREVLDAVSILRFIVLPYDTENLVLLLRSPWFKVPDTVIANWAAQTKDDDLNWDYILAAGSEEVGVRALKKLIDASYESGVFLAWVESLTSCGVLDTSIHYDPTGRRESNVWKLVSIVREAQRQSGFSFTQFLDKVSQGVQQFDDEEGEAIAVIEPNRVNIMTVHKAKGLKFNQVIVPNMHKGPRTVLDNRSQKSLVVFDEDQKKWGVRLPMGEDNKKEDLITCLGHLERFSVREFEENKRLYYVAITRAVEKCLFTWIGQPAHNSWAQYLPTVSESGLIQKTKYALETLIETGPAEPIALTQSLSETVKPPFTAEGAQQVLHRSRLSVSAILDLAEQNMTSTEVPIREAASAQEIEKRLGRPEFGVRLHSALQKLKYDWDFDFSNLAAQTTDSKKFLQALEFVKNLASPPLKQVIEQGEVEWGFQLKTKKGVIEGQIDLWGEVNGEIWVVDYKSGDSRYSEKAFRQLELYAYALTRYRPGKPVKLAVIYPLLKKVETKTLRNPVEIAQDYGFS
jgi:ATP-dependent helicase/nuclease subunit A